MMAEPQGSSWSTDLSVRFFECFFFLMERFSFPHVGACVCARARVGGVCVRAHVRGVCTHVHACMCVTHLHVCLGLFFLALVCVPLY